MAKALTIILLLAATAAIAAAHPSLGKGGSITVTKTSSSADQGGSGGNKNSGGCKCKDDCQNVERKVCREVEVEKEVCKDEDQVVEEVVCVQRCFKADKVISVGKGRRLSAANIIGKGASSGITLSKDAGAAGTPAPAPAPAPAARQQQEVCRDVCKPERKTVTNKVCKKVKNMERVDCRVVSVEPVCAKSCECGFIGGKGKGH